MTGAPSTLKIRETARATRPLAAWTGWAFVLCTAVTIGYGLWTVYGSGTRIVLLNLLDGTKAGSPSSTSPPPDIGPINIPLGPIGLAKEMNPLRAVLRAAYAPVGSTRIQYQLTIVDDADKPVLEKDGVLGNPNDHAPLVRTTTSLGDFTLVRPRAYFVRVRMAGGSTDNLRGATLELRSNVLPVDARIPWGFGILALGCLILNRVASRGRPLPSQLPQEQEEIRKAA
jgi:hypothetical protein